MSDQPLVPAAIAGVQDGLPVNGRAVSQGNIFFLMGNTKGEEGHVVNLLCCSRSDFTELKRKWNTACRELAIHRAIQSAYALFESGRPDNHQRLSAKLFVGIFEKEEWQPAEMIAMQVANSDKINAF